MTRQAAESQTVRMGHPFLTFESVSSTNDVAKDEALRGAPEGLTVMAHHQERGRGRQGRLWYSPAGEGMYLSVLLRPAIPAYESNWLGIVGSLATARALEQAGLNNVTIKWPNDVLVRGLKIAGILVEPRVQADVVQFAVVGIGINVAQKPGEWTRALKSRATSCLIEGLSVSCQAMAQLTLRQLEKYYRAFKRGARQSLFREWGRRTGQAEMPILG